MIKCNKCGREYQYDGSYYCICGNILNDSERIKEVTMSLYTEHLYSLAFEKGKESFISNISINNNPYNPELEIFNYWENGWKEAQSEHSSFVKIQKLKEENKKIKKERDNIIMSFIKVIKQVHMSLFPYIGKFFRFGQSSIVDKNVINLDKFIKEIEHLEKKEKINKL